jgi:SAM-dependent methyltransferase
MSTPVDPTVLRYYAEEWDEGARLADATLGPLELARTRELLRRVLPPAPADVLDVGGGTGVHAAWLAADGYAVTVVDPVARHVEQAATLPGVHAVVGHAGALPAQDSSVDAVLLLGPLYHLTQAADRAAALAEAVRVVRPGGVVAAVAISRHSELIELAALGTLDEAAAGRMERVLATGMHDASAGFTVAYLHQWDELRAELAIAGLRGVLVYGVEGPGAGAMRVPSTEGASADDRLASAVRAARLVETDAQLVSSSPHLLAVGHKPA